MKSSKAAIFFVLALGIGLGVWGTQWWLEHQGPGISQAAPAAPTAAAPANDSKVKVAVAPVNKVRRERVVSAGSTLRSHDSVMLRPESRGRIPGRNFEAGGQVRAGAVLVGLADSAAT